MSDVTFPGLGFAGWGSMATYRRGEGTWSRSCSAGLLFCIALFGCTRLASFLATHATWGRRVFLSVPPVALTGAWMVAGALLAACAVGLWMLMNHARVVDFLVDMESELRKVSWPVDRSQPKFSARYGELIQSSMIVIVSVLVMGVALFLYDATLGTGIQWILETKR